jgi:hypothetical protein
VQTFAATLSDSFDLLCKLDCEGGCHLPKLDPNSLFKFFRKLLVVPIAITRREKGIVRPITAWNEEVERIIVADTIEASGFVSAPLTARLSTATSPQPYRFSSQCFKFMSISRAMRRYSLVID